MTDSSTPETVGMGTTLTNEHEKKCFVNHNTIELCLCLSYDKTRFFRNWSPD